jgi:hypothetical protein
MGADSGKSAGLLQGTLELLILRTLATGEKHGYEIAEWIHADHRAPHRLATPFQPTAVQRHQFRRSDMRRLMMCTTAAVFSSVLALRMPVSAESPQTAAVQQIDLAERVAAGKLRAVNREVTALPGNRPGVHVTEKEGPGVVWIEGSDFAQGTIEMEVRGRDVQQRSFVGVAFHRGDDNTYDAVYLRPFNFRAEDPVRRQNAVQYMAVPEYDWPRLRKEFPHEFEHPVDASVAPTEWVPLRVVVKGRTVQVFVGAAAKSPALEVRKLGSHDHGAIGLWVGNNSDGDFTNLRITPMK